MYPTTRTLTAQLFQVLFHSLFKVLFIFRSHYLCAIGLGGNIEPSQKYTCEFVQHSQTARLLEQENRVVDARWT